MTGILLADSSGALGALFGLVFLLIYLAVLGLFLYSAWKVWEKMGDPGWMGIVPFLNIYRVFQRSRPDQAVLFTILSVVPCVSFVMVVILWNDLGKLFNKSIVHGAIIPLLAFGDATYAGPPPPRLG